MGQARMKAKSKLRVGDALNIAKTVTLPVVIAVRWAIALSAVSLVIASLALWAVLWR